jgi:small GTP-binding protein
VIQKKVCMVGFAGTGKTSLVRQFVHAKFADKYLSTVGVKVDRKEVAVAGGPVNLLLWDIEGRDGAQDLQTSYLRGASGIIYVVDGTRRETFAVLTELRDAVLGAVGETPAVVAFNKADLTAEWKLTAADQATVSAAGFHVLTTSAKTGAGVEDAFTWLAGRMIAGGAA